MRRLINDGEGGYVIARTFSNFGGEWLVTAHSSDLRGEAQGYVIRDMAGFVGRQWTSDIDGQQYPTLKAAMLAAQETANLMSLVAIALEQTA